VFAKIITNAEISKVVVDAYPVQFKQATESKKSHLFVIGADGTGKSTFAQSFSEVRNVFGIDMLSYGPKGFTFTRENAKVGTVIARSLLAQTQVCVVFTYAGKASSFEVFVKGHGRRVPNSEIIVLGEILSKAHTNSVLESTKTHRRQLREVVTLPGFEVFIKTQPTRHCVPPPSNAVGRLPAMLGTLP
jgi:Tfp pilus assembly ATPase PilU